MGGLYDTQAGSSFPGPAPAPRRRRIDPITGLESLTDEDEEEAAVTGGLPQALVDKYLTPLPTEGTPPPPAPTPAPALGKDKEPVRPSSSGISGDIADVNATILKGIIGIPEAAVGLADVVTAPYAALLGERTGYVGRGLESLGFTPKAWKERLSTYYSPEQQEANRAIQEAKGVGGTLRALYENPRAIPHTILESIPGMLAGGGVSRGAVRLGMKALPAAALGEGSIAAGSQQESIRQQTPGGLTTPMQSAAAAGTGLVTAGVNLLGGRFAGSKLAQRLGVVDPDLLMTGVAKGAAKVPGNLAKALGTSAVSEGLEELGQGVPEQVLQNLALGRPAGEGVGQAGVLGFVSGAAMGGGAAGIQAAGAIRARGADQALKEYDLTETMVGRARGVAGERTPADEAQAVEDWIRDRGQEPVDETEVHYQERPPSPPPSELLDQDFLAGPPSDLLDQDFLAPGEAPAAPAPTPPPAPVEDVDFGPTYGDINDTAARGPVGPTYLAPILQELPGRFGNEKVRRKKEYDRTLQEFAFMHRPGSPIPPNLNQVFEVGQPIPEFIETLYKKKLINRLRAGGTLRPEIMAQYPELADVQVDPEKVARAAEWREGQRAQFAPTPESQARAARTKHAKEQTRIFEAWEKEAERAHKAGEPIPPMPPTIPGPPPPPSLYPVLEDPEGYIAAGLKGPALLEAVRRHGYTALSAGEGIAPVPPTAASAKAAVDEVTETRAAEAAAESAQATAEALGVSRGTAAQAVLPGAPAPAAATAAPGNLEIRPVGTTSKYGVYRGARRLSVHNSPAEAMAAQKRYEAGAVPPKREMPPRPGTFPQDEQGQFIYPGEEDLTPEQRRLLTETARARVTQLAQEERAQPTGRIVAGEGFIASTSKKTGTPLEDVSAGTTAMLKAVDKDRGNVLEREIRSELLRKDGELADAMEDVEEAMRDVPTDDMEGMEDFGEEESEEIGPQYSRRPAPGQLGLEGIGEEVAPAREAKRAPVQQGLFGAGALMQGVAPRTTEGREAEGALFTQEREAQAKAEAGRQQTLGEPTPAEPARAEPTRDRAQIESEQRGRVGKLRFLVERAGLLPAETRQRQGYGEKIATLLAELDRGWAGLDAALRERIEGLLPPRRTLDALIAERTAERGPQQMARKPEIEDHPLAGGAKVRFASRAELGRIAAGEWDPGTRMEATADQDGTIVIRNDVPPQRVDDLIAHEAAHRKFAEDETGDLEQLGESILNDVRRVVEGMGTAEEYGISPKTVTHLRKYLDRDDMNEASLIEEAYATEVGHQDAANYRAKRGPQQAARQAPATEVERPTGEERPRRALIQTHPHLAADPNYSNKDKATSAPLHSDSRHTVANPELDVSAETLAEIAKNRHVGRLTRAISAAYDKIRQALGDNGTRFVGVNPSGQQYGVWFKPRGQRGQMRSNFFGSLGKVLADIRREGRKPTVQEIASRLAREIVGVIGHEHMHGDGFTHDSKAEDDRFDAAYDAAEKKLLALREQLEAPIRQLLEANHGEALHAIERLYHQLNPEWNAHRAAAAEAARVKAAAENQRKPGRAPSVPHVAPLQRAPGAQPQRPGGQGVPAAGRPAGPQLARDVRGGDRAAPAEVGPAPTDRGRGPGAGGRAAGAGEGGGARGGAGGEVGTVVKRAKGFTEFGGENQGIYEVTANGQTHRIYRDPESGWWYLPPGAPLIGRTAKRYVGDAGTGRIGFNKAEAVKWIEDQTAEGGPQQMATAYHGSPHPKFDKFSTKKVGTGEGGQMYGWGLYFASKREVAEHYKTALARGGMAYEGEYVPRSEMDDWIAKTAKHENVPVHVIDSMLYDWRNGETPRRIKERIENLYGEEAALAVWHVMNGLEQVGTGQTLMPARGKRAVDSMTEAEKSAYYDMMGSAHWYKPEKAIDELRKTAEGIIKAQTQNLTYPRLGPEERANAQKLIEQYEEHLRVLDKYGLRVLDVPKGALYKVELAPEEHEYLHWDKPISSQSPHVQAALEKLGIKVATPKAIEAANAEYSAAYKRYEAGPSDETADEVERTYNEWTALREAARLQGSDVYKQLATQFGGREGHKEGLASAALHDAGIPGIKYLDQGSRNVGSLETDNFIAEHGSRGKALEVAERYLAAAEKQGSGFGQWQRIVDELKAEVSHNYVIFDDSLIDITEVHQQARKPGEELTPEELEARKAELAEEEAAAAVARAQAEAAAETPVAEAEAPTQGPPDFAGAYEAGGGDIEAKPGALHPHPDIGLNIQKYDLPTEVQERLSAAVESLDAAGALPRDRPMTTAEVNRLAAELSQWIDREDFRKQFSKASRNSVAMVTAMRRIILEGNARTEAALTHLQNLRDQGAPAKEIARAHEAYIKESTDHAADIAAFSGKVTEAARILAFQKQVLKSGRTQAEQIHDTITKALHDQGISKGDAQAVFDLYMKSRSGMAADQDAFAGALRKAFKIGRLAKIIELWKAMLLSAPSTPVANALGNGLNLMADIAKTGMAGVLDAHNFLRGQPRERYVGEMGAQFGGVLNAIPTAIRNLMSDFGKIGTLKPEEIDVLGGGKLEYQVGAISGKKGRGVRIPFRILDATDNFFKALIAGGESSKLAHRDGRKRGYSGEPLVRHMQDVIQRINEGVDEDLVAQVVAAQKRGTFQTETGGAGQHLQSMKRSMPWLEFILPFLRTPANIAKTTFQMTPGGLLVVARDIRAGKLSKGEIQDKLALTMVGTTFAGIMVAAAKAGLLTGSGPTDEKERQLKLSTGWQPNSVHLKIGGKDRYVSFSRFEPIGALMGMAADVIEAGDEKQAKSIVEKLIGSLASNLTSKTYLQGLSEFFQFYSDPVNRAGSYLAQLAGTVVPNIAARGAAAIDPTLRETKAETLGGRIGKTIASRIPGVSQTLQPRYTATGRIKERGGNAFTRFASPAAYSVAQGGMALENELIRIGAVPGEIKREVKLPGGATIRLSDAEFTQLQRANFRAASEAARLMRTSYYRRLPDTAEEGGTMSKEHLMKQVFSKARADARRIVGSRSDFRRRAGQALREIRSQARQARV